MPVNLGTDVVQLALTSGGTPFGTLRRRRAVVLLAEFAGFVALVRAGGPAVAWLPGIASV
jgi:hypothetical protein